MNRRELNITICDYEEILSDVDLTDVIIYITNGVVEEKCLYDGELRNLSDFIGLSEEGVEFKLDTGEVIIHNNYIKFYLTGITYEAIFHYVLGSSVIYEFNFDMEYTHTVSDLNEFIRSIELFRVVGNVHLDCVSLSGLFPEVSVEDTNSETFLYLDRYEELELKLVDINGNIRDITEGALVGIYGNLVITITKDYVGFITTIDNESKIYRIYREDLFEPNPFMYILKNLIIL